MIYATPDVSLHRDAALQLLRPVHDDVYFQHFSNGINFNGH